MEGQSGLSELSVISWVSGVSVKRGYTVVLSYTQYTHSLEEISYTYVHWNVINILFKISFPTRKLVKGSLNQEG